MEHLHIAGRQGGRDVAQLEEDRVADEREQDRRGDARLLLDTRAVAPSAAAPAILEGIAVALLGHGALEEPVARHPPALVPVPELGADLGDEPVEEVEEGGGVAAHERACEDQGLGHRLGEDACRDALRRAPRLVLVDLVADEQVEEALHAPLHVVGQGEAARA
ncbi:MAG: hypothetical protein O2888_05900, partial [Chloroflexi bacterium]|nr:hypothetical protein [Chloroflexota bacterium]